MTTIDTSDAALDVVVMEVLRNCGYAYPGSGSKRVLSAIAPILRAREEAVKAENARLREALDKLARLGNEPYYGNSTGNAIARAALEATPKLPNPNPS